MAEDRQQQQSNREIPLTDLELQSMLANPEWGRRDDPEIKKRLTHISVIKDKHGSPIFDEDKNPIVDTEDEYGVMAFINRDFRLGNLNKFSGEREWAEHYANIAHDCLQSGFKKSHSAALARVAVKLELSQSDAGFFRKIMNTFRQETTQTTFEPNKRTLFGMTKQQKQQQQGGGY